MKHSFIIFFLLIVLSFSVIGCGKEDQELKTYKEDIKLFLDAINHQNEMINAINPDSDTAIDDLLDNLNCLQEEFDHLSELNVPYQFSATESLAQEASKYMEDAVNLYTDAFKAEEYDDITMELANENYARALKRIHYIGDILAGRVPDGEDISINYEDSEISSETIE